MRPSITLLNLVVALLLAWSTATPAATQAPHRYVQATFNAPLSDRPFRPQPGPGTHQPQAVTGNPLVTPTFAAFTQPLLLNAELGNGPCCYQEEVAFRLTGPASPVYLIGFDLGTAGLAGSRNHLRVLLNEGAEATLTFSEDGLILWEGSQAVARYEDGSVLRVQLRLDLPARQLSLSINGERLHRADTRLSSLTAVRFAMSSADGLTPDQIDPEPFAALDNVVISNDSDRSVNLHTRITQVTTEATSGQQVLEVAVTNRGDHQAHALVLTHLLPKQMELVAVDSDIWHCQPGDRQILCTAPELDSQAQAAVRLTLRGQPPLPGQTFTSIVVSQDDEIDNADNRSIALAGGSPGLMLLVAGLVLLGGRRRMVR